jgi:hypothetical protein
MAQTVHELKRWSIGEAAELLHTTQGLGQVDAVLVIEQGSHRLAEGPRDRRGPNAEAQRGSSSTELQDIRRG